MSDVHQLSTRIRDGQRYIALHYDREGHNLWRWRSSYPQALILWEPYEVTLMIKGTLCTVKQCHVLWIPETASPCVEDDASALIVDDYTNPFAEPLESTAFAAAFAASVASKRRPRVPSPPTETERELEAQREAIRRTLALYGDGSKSADPANS